ncbi:MAG: uracil-DNA glycosylase family protein [Pseudomonadota bacterium]
MSIDALATEIRGCRRCAPRFAETRTAHAPRPVPWLSAEAPILVCGQAPGLKVHERGRPFDDASGDRLRAWMGIDREAFYDQRKIAVLPMAFCFPGYDARGSDLPPPAICASTWRARALNAMPNVQLTLLIGAYAQRWHLGKSGRSVTETVADWEAAPSHLLPLPHPSWRNTAWLKRNTWFETELVPVLRARVCNLLEER